MLHRSWKNERAARSGVQHKTGDGKVERSVAWQMGCSAASAGRHLPGPCSHRPAGHGGQKIRPYIPGTHRTRMMAGSTMPGSSNGCENRLSSPAQYSNGRAGKAPGLVRRCICLMAHHFPGQLPAILCQYQPPPRYAGQRHRLLLDR